MDQSNWVDFRAVKAAVSMKAVLDHYQVNWLRKSGHNLVGRCPIHRGEGDRTFHVSLEKGGFKCFSCEARGNVLDFVAAMEQCSVREAALKLKDWFGVPMPEQPASAGAKKRTERAPGKVAKPVGEEPTTNKPLAFALKAVDAGHAYLASRRVSRQTAEAFGVGFFPGKGSMQGRVVVPIHNAGGELVAYAGRSIDGSEPKYKLPAGFHKALELYNLHRVSGEEVVIVEGFFDCLKVHQAGFPGVVALMGCSLSGQQERLLVERFKRVRVMLDGDAAGRKGTEEIAARLARKLWVRIVELPEGKQPDMLEPGDLQNLLSL